MANAQAGAVRITGENRHAKAKQCMSKIFQAFVSNEKTIRRILARYFSSPEDVDELTQETFLRCFAAEAKTKIDEPKAFLFQSAKNLALGELNKKHRKTTDYLEDSAGADVIKDDRQESAEARLDSRQKLTALAMAIARLPPECRRVFMMRKMENLKPSQIATRLDVSVSTVQKRIAKSLVLCDAHLRALGYDPIEFGNAGPRAKETAPVVKMPRASAMGRSDNDE